MREFTYPLTEKAVAEATGFDPEDMAVQLTVCMANLCYELGKLGAALENRPLSETLAKVFPELTANRRAWETISGPMNKLFQQAYLAGAKK
jgi:hypothetical protein